MVRKRLGFLFSLFAILLISFFVSLSFISAGLISSSGSIVSDGPLYDVDDEIFGGTFCSGEEYCSDYSDSLECESNGCTWNDEPGSVGVASIRGNYGYNAQWNFKNNNGNKTGAAIIIYNNINYNIQCTNGVNCTQIITNEQGSSTEEINFPLDGYVFNNNSGWFIDLFSSVFECTMGLCGGSAINVQENINTSKAVVKDSYYPDKVVRDFKFSAKGEEECGIINFGSLNVCNYESSVLEKWVPDVHFIEASCYLDPEYIEETFEKRKFKPTEITPFDDIICEARIRVEPYLSQFKTKPSLKGELYTLDENGEWKVLITESKEPMEFAFTNKTSNGDYLYDIYQWKIKGWEYDLNNGFFSFIFKKEGIGNPVGWTEDDLIIEKLINNSQFGKNLRFFAYDAFGLRNNITQNIQSSNCLQLWGEDNSKFKISYRYGNLPFRIYKSLVEKVVGIVQEGFFKIDPFARYKFDFTHYVDLLGYDTSRAASLYSENVAGLGQDIVSSSSCQKSSMTHVLFAGSNLVDYENAYTRLNVNWIISHYTEGGTTIIHEMAHAFAGVSDEYLYSIFMNSPLTGKILNCFTASEVCSKFEPYGKPYVYCTSGGLFRTSKCSIMGCGDESTLFKGIAGNVSQTESSLIRKEIDKARGNKFNDWSCGVILQKLDSKGSAKENAKYCKNNFVTVSEVASDFECNIQCGFSKDCENLGYDRECVECDSNKCVPLITSKECFNYKVNLVGTCSNGECTPKEPPEECRIQELLDCTHSGKFDFGCSICTNSKCEEFNSGGICEILSGVVSEGICSSGKCIADDSP